MDKAPKIPKEGLNEDFGFYVNRPFYIVSRLPMKRVVQCHGATHVRLNRYKLNNKTQQYYFDPVSKTIRSTTGRTMPWKSNPMEDTLT